MEIHEKNVFVFLVVFFYLLSKKKRISRPQHKISKQKCIYLIRIIITVIYSL